MDIQHWTQKNGTNKYRPSLHPAMLDKDGLEITNLRKNVITVYDKDYVLSKLQAELVTPFSKFYDGDKLEDKLSDLMRLACRTTDTTYLKNNPDIEFCGDDNLKFLLQEELPDEL